MAQALTAASRRIGYLAARQPRVFIGVAGLACILSLQGAALLASAL